MKNKIILLPCLGLFACKAKKAAVKPTNESNNTQMETDMSMAELDMGKHIYENKCGSCHALKNPAFFTIEALNKIVPTMVDKANTKKGADIGDLEKVLLVKYLLSGAKNK